MKLSLYIFGADEAHTLVGWGIVLHYFHATIVLIMFSTYLRYLGLVYQWSGRHVL